MAKRTELTDEQVERAFRTYVRKQMSLQDFAEMLNLSPVAASHLLRGLSWRHVRRPDGFVYPPPWQKPKTMYALTDAHIEEALNRYIELNWTIEDLAQDLDVPLPMLHRILRGESHKTVKIPENFVLRTAKDVHDRKVEEALKIFYQENWTQKQLAQHLGISHQAVSRMLKGDSYPDIRRPKVWWDQQVKKKK